MEDVCVICGGGISEVFQELAISSLDKQFWRNSNVQILRAKTRDRSSCVAWINRGNKITVDKIFTQIVIYIFLSSSAKSEGNRSSLIHSAFICRLEFASIEENSENFNA